MNRNRVAPGGAREQQAQCVRTHSGGGASRGGSHQKLGPIDDTDTGPTARPDTGELLKCILNSHG